MTINMFVSYSMMDPGFVIGAWVSRGCVCRRGPPDQHHTVWGEISMRDYQSIRLSYPQIIYYASRGELDWMFSQVLVRLVEQCLGLVTYYMYIVLIHVVSSFTFQKSGIFLIFLTLVIALEFYRLLWGNFLTSHKSVVIKIMFTS